MERSLFAAICAMVVDSLTMTEASDVLFLTSPMQCCDRLNGLSCVYLFFSICKMELKGITES